MTKARKKPRKNWTDYMQENLTPLLVGESIIVPIGERFFHDPRGGFLPLEITVTENGLKIERVRK